MDACKLVLEVYKENLKLKQFRVVTPFISLKSMSFLLSYSITRVCVVVHLLNASKSALLFILFMSHLLALALFYHFLKNRFTVFAAFAWKLFKKLVHIFTKRLEFLIYLLFRSYFFFFWFILLSRNSVLTFARFGLANFLNFFDLFDFR